MKPEVDFMSHENGVPVSTPYPVDNDLIAFLFVVHINYHNIYVTCHTYCNKGVHMNSNVTIWEKKKKKIHIKTNLFLLQPTFVESLNKKSINLYF